MSYFQQFGGAIKAHHKKQFASSENWDGNKFLNFEETALEFTWSGAGELMRKQLFERKIKEPQKPIPYLPYDKAAFHSPSGKMKAIWYGHSVVKLRINDNTMLIDPMFGPNASPIAPFATRRFSENTISLIDDFDDIDLVLFTHDHYDHLDLMSMQKLKNKVRQYFVPLGFGRHLVQWGIPEDSITEFDWWDHKDFQGIEITFTPTRHFSGRGLTDRFKSLWGGWVFKTGNENIYFSGDGGYGHHFKEVGKKLGPFDFGFMESGQYNENWHQLHLYPEESVQAAKDAGVFKVMPVHWAGFALAPHDWKEPVNRFVAAAEEASLPVIYPEIGAIFSISDNPDKRWWTGLS
ncbi:MAG: MBL fold metallo-hydrolase [Bacteroidota bacterium]